MFRELKRGYTTGSCAAAAAKAAAQILLSQRRCENVMIVTPAGIAVTLDVLDIAIMREAVSCAVRKASGDDPDITDGVLVYAKVTKRDSNSFDPRHCSCDSGSRPVNNGDEPVPLIEIVGGDGVGRVTKPGLDQPVGAYAINSEPRRQITKVCAAVCEEYGYGGGLTVVISIPGGEKLAERTLNARLGIVGGLSVLGTTGIVEPMSARALIETIRAQLSVLRAGGSRSVLFTIGNIGERFARDRLGLSMTTHVTCSNFVGDAIYLAEQSGFEYALIVGHIGKLVKLGLGIFNTHSDYGDGRMETLISCALEAGAGLSVLRGLLECGNTDAAIEVIKMGESGLLAASMSVLRTRIDAALSRKFARAPTNSVSQSEQNNTNAVMKIGFLCFYGRGDAAEVCVANEIAHSMLICKPHLS